MNSKAIFAIIFVFVGCCSNVVFLELLVKEDPGIGNLITFLQFAFIALEGFIFTSKCGTKRPKIGLKDYSVLVFMFFFTNVCNNYAFDFNIPMPLHMIFRAGSLIANMIMGIVILKKEYALSKYVSVLMITTGIVACTIVSGKEVTPSKVVDIKEDLSSFSAVFWWTVGIVLLTVALLVSARMGIYQEYLVLKYGKNPSESLFYTHLLPLPGFLFLYNNIAEHIALSNASAPILLPILNFTMPIQWIYLIGDVLTQYLCISSVYILTTECSSLTVTLIITLRKFVSLLFSILYFNNKFTLVHWLGTALVFIGTFIFTDIVGMIKSAQHSQKQKLK